MFERLTDPARRVVVLAQEEARSLGHDSLGTEHLLLGLLQQGEGVVAEALGAWGISRGAVREQVQEVIGRGSSSAPSGRISVTPGAKQVLELSLREALQLGHNYVGPEHLLYGLVAEGSGVAAQVLVGLGVDRDRVRQRIVSVLIGSQGRTTAPAPVPAPVPVPVSVSVSVPDRGEALPSRGGGLFGRFTTRARRVVGLAEKETREEEPSFRRGGLFEGFTDRARRVVGLAEEEARSLNHPYIGTEHLLLGLVHEGEGIGAQTLVSLGISLEAVRDQVQEVVGRGAQAPSGRIPLTPRAKKVLELSLEESLELDRRLIGTEHLLLAIVREGAGAAARILVRLGVDLNRARAQALIILDGQQKSAAAPAPEVGQSREPGDPSPRNGLFERLTDPARRVVVLAQEEARSLGHDSLGTEHLLLGLLQQGEGVVAEALGAWGISRGAVREQVQEVIGRGSSSAPSGRISVTPGAKQVLELSLREALQLGHNYVGPEHLLYGLVAEGSGVAAQVLVGLGVDRDRVRQRIVSVLIGSQGRTTAPAPVPAPVPVPVSVSVSVPDRGEALPSRGGGLFGRFTTRARRVVVLAEEEARSLNHPYIGTEHLLLGLVHEGEGLGAQTLVSLGISLEAVRDQVQEVIGRGAQAPSGRIPLTPRAKKVLELSLSEALPLGSSYIGTEHLLLGLVREGEGVAAQILVRLGTDLGRVRQRAIEHLTGEPQASGNG